MKRYEWITLALIVVFGLLGAWFFENNNEWLSNFCVLPPLGYYIFNIIPFRDVPKNKFEWEKNNNE